MASIIKQFYRTKSKTDEIKIFIDKYLALSKQTVYKGEKAVEKEIVKQLRQEFEGVDIASQFAVGGFLGLKCDIDICNGQCGIELKVAKQLNNATALQRVIGQVFYYSQRRYKETGLILLVVGTHEKLDPRFKELKDFVEQIPGVHFMYKQADKK